MSYKRYTFTAKDISREILKTARKRIKPQSIIDHRNGKRKNPTTLDLIAEAEKGLLEKMGAGK